VIVHNSVHGTHGLGQLVVPGAGHVTVIEINFMDALGDASDTQSTTRVIHIRDILLSDTNSTLTLRSAQFVAKHHWNTSIAEQGSMAISNSNRAINWSLPSTQHAGCSRCTAAIGLTAAVTIFESARRLSIRGRDIAVTIPQRSCLTPKGKHSFIIVKHHLQSAQITSRKNKGLGTIFSLQDHEGLAKDHPILH
jgi:hypothetical protein